MEKEQEVEMATKVKEQYLTKDEKRTKLDELKEMDNKVKQPAIVSSCIIGSVGCLVFGAGMSSVLVWSNLTLALALGIPGLLVTLLSYPIYKSILNKRKAKYSNKIIELSNAIIGE